MNQVTEIRDADPQETAEWREALAAVRTLQVPACILVSHEPLTSQLVARLASGDDALEVRFTPATAVLLDVDRRERARLIERVTPETLMHATDH